MAPVERGEAAEEGGLGGRSELTADEVRRLPAHHRRHDEAQRGVRKRCERADVVDVVGVGGGV